MSKAPQPPDEQYESPSAEDIDTSHEPATVIAGAQQSPPNDGQGG